MSADLGAALTDGLGALSRAEEVGAASARRQELGGLTLPRFLPSPVQTRRLPRQLPAAVDPSQRGA